MLGDGKTLNHPVYVENLIDVFELAATVPGAKGRVYLAGDEHPVTLTELVRGVGAALGTQVRIIRFPWYDAAKVLAAVIEVTFKKLGIKPPVFRRRLSWYRTNRAFSIERARTELGYRPRVGLAEGLGRTAQWYRSEGLLQPSRKARAGVVDGHPSVAMASDRGWRGRIPGASPRRSK